MLPGAALGQKGWSRTTLQLFEETVIARYPNARLYVQPQDPLIDPALVSATSLVRPPGLELEEERASELEEQFKKSLQVCIDHVLVHPRWSLSMQTHKFAGLQ